MNHLNSDAAIRSIIEERAKAVLAGNVDAIVADLADDVVIYDVVDPLSRTGKPSSRERAATWVASYDGPITLENRDLRSRSAATLRSAMH